LFRSLGTGEGVGGADDVVVVVVPVVEVVDVALVDVAGSMFILSMTWKTHFVIGVGVNASVPLGYALPIVGLFIGLFIGLIVGLITESHRR
jgi:hypothetical protein